MKYFKDSELKQEIQNIDFGIVSAGTTKEHTVYLKNDTKALLNNFVIEAVGMEVVYTPKEIHPNGSDKITLKWTPSVSERVGMVSKLAVKYDEIYR